MILQNEIQLQIHKQRTAFSAYKKTIIEKIDKYEWLLQVTFVFVFSRLIVFGAAHVGGVMLATELGHWNPAPENPFSSLFARWDSQWYYWIIEHGYWLRPNQRSNVAFFPLYPLLVTTLKPLFGNNIILTSLMVSNAALFGALIFLYKLTLLEFKDNYTAQRTILYLAIFPTSFFLSSMYTESLFLFSSIGAVYFARKQQWSWAALMGILTSATRVVGVVTWGIVCGNGCGCMVGH